MALSLSTPKTSCRVCLSTQIEPVLDLGPTPPANAFLSAGQLSQAEPIFPLVLQRCGECGFIQLSEVVSPELLFRNYVYVSSTSPHFVTHFAELAQSLSQRFNWPLGALVVDIGSNDGILLRPFKELGWRVLGIDPATKIAALASANGLETWNDFFSPTLADQIVAAKGPAKLVTATSVFPHIDDLDSLVKAVKRVLDDDGVFMVEAYYLLAMLEHNLFDTVYHEHLSYFTVQTYQRLMDRLGLTLFDVELTDTHGGSLRLLAQRPDGPHPINSERLSALVAQERAAGLNQAPAFSAYSQRIASNKTNLRQLLTAIKARGQRVAGYGAPAKATTLMHYFEIGPEQVDYIIDDSSWKQGLYTPGLHIPVYSAEQLTTSRPDYLLILAWNFADPIMAKYQEYHQSGGRFIIPVPEPRVVS